MNAAVIGAGAWGTALACQLSRNGHDTVLWFRSPEKAALAQETRVNPRLKNAVLPPQLLCTADPQCVRGCELVVIAAPSFPIRSVCQTVAPYLDESTVMVSVTKGIEEGSLLRMSQIVAQETSRPVVALSGPCHAEEVAIQVPTGCLAACEDKRQAEFVQDAFMSETFRVYTSPDAVGAVGGHYGKIIQLAHPAALRPHHQKISCQRVAVKHAPCVGGALRFAGQDHAQGLQLPGGEVPAHLVQIHLGQLRAGEQPPCEGFGTHTIKNPFRCRFAQHHIFCPVPYSIPDVLPKVNLCTLSSGSAAGFAKGLASGRRIGYYTGNRIFPSGAAGRASR